jgi:GTP-binding protein YchF
MKVALTGYTNSGRSTIFQSICDSFTEICVDKGKLRVKLGRAEIYDPRLDEIARIYSSQKKTFSEIQFNDFEYCQDDIAEKQGLDDHMVANLKMTDALIYVVRGFRNEGIFYRFPDINPLRDAENLESDMIITDLTSTENRLAKLSVELKKGKKDQQVEYDILTKIKSVLDAERPLRLEEINEEDAKQIRGFGFLSMKKCIVLVNAEDDGSFHGDENTLRKWASDRGIGVLILRGRLQAELKELNEEDRKIFQEEMGVEESAVAKLVTEIFNTVGLIHFFTGGDKEARQWITKKGSTACEAAGVIHTDFQTNFIRAEVIKYEDLLKCGSEKACKDAGVYRSEKREYIVQDGDCMFFRHG